MLRLNAGIGTEMEAEIRELHAQGLFVHGELDSAFRQRYAPAREEPTVEAPKPAETAIFKPAEPVPARPAVAAAPTKLLSYGEQLAELMAVRKVGPMKFFKLTGLSSSYPHIATLPAVGRPPEETMIKIGKGLKLSETEAEALASSAGYTPNERVRLAEVLFGARKPVPVRKTDEPDYGEKLNAIMRAKDIGPVNFEKMTGLSRGYPGIASLVGKPKKALLLRIAYGIRLSEKQLDALASSAGYNAVEMAELTIRFRRARQNALRERLSIERRE